MIRSMTAFASAHTSTNQFTLMLEIRSVNHRYLELNQRLPDNLRELETRFRERCRQRLERGKIDISLRYQLLDGALPLSLNRERVQQLADITREAGDIVLHAAPISLTDILQLPGVLETPEADIDPIKQAALALLDDALDTLLANREREGASLKQFIEQRLQGVEEQLALVRQKLPLIISERRDAIRQQAEELAETNPERLEQALVDLLQKLDVDEELSRLEAHIKEARFQLNQPHADSAQNKKSLGRRLDFLMQEFNREANTLGSKSAAVDTTQAAIELKVLIEQMREQIQNIE